MDRRNLAQCTHEQLVAEIRRASADLEDTARYMGQASMLLHERTRRLDFREAAGRTASIPDGTSREEADRLRQAAVNEVASVFALYSNTWHRFAGMVLQGVRRTTSSERIMKRLEEKRRVTAESGTTPSTPVPKRTKEPVAEVPMEDLVALYGEETVNHAQR